MSCASPYFMAPEPQELAPHDVALYLGKRGTRKSTRAKALSGRCMKRRRRVLALDPHDEWSIHGRESDQVILGPLRQRFDAWEVLAEPSILERDNLCAAIVPSEMDPEAWAAVFKPILLECLDIGDLDLFMDEVPSWAEYCEKTLNAVALNSRHSRMAVVAIGQRAKKFPLTFRSQATLINSGLQTEPADLAALEDVAGKDFAEAVRQLERGQYCQWRDDMGGPRPSTTRKKKP
jgi:hypothetical protein